MFNIYSYKKSNIRWKIQCKVWWEGMLKQTLETRVPHSHMALHKSVVLELILMSSKIMANFFIF